MTVGIATTLTVTQPKSILEAVLAVSVGTLGATISDIDVETSDAHQEVNKVIAIAIATIVGVIVIDTHFHMELINKIIGNRSYIRTLFGLLLCIGVCAFGKEQPHRSFMHSFLALGLLSVGIGCIWTMLVPYFVVGFLSHVAIDSLNKRKVMLLYPLKGGVALRLCRADGIVNDILFLLSSVMIVAEGIMFMLRLIRKI